jgi:trypsin
VARASSWGRTSGLAMSSGLAALVLAAGSAQAEPRAPQRSVTVAGQHAAGKRAPAAGEHAPRTASEARAPRRRARAHASIIGGYLPAATQWPWMAYLRHSNGEFCGGVLLAPARVLTAAHCVTEADGSVSTPGSMQIVIGRRRLSETTAGETFAVTAVTRNPAFTTRADKSLDYDTAVLTLSRASSASPATLGSEADWGKEVTVMGWGHTNHVTDEFSDDLLAADLPTWTDAQCESSWGADYDAATNFCAGYYNGEKAVCHGDSGGPVMTTPDQGATWRLIGVVSVVKAPCNVPGYPGIFAWVAGAALRPWVVSAVAAPPPAPPAAPPASVPAPAASPPPKVASAPLTMSRSDAIYALRQLIRHKTHHAARHLTATCRRTSAVSFLCRVGFRAGGRRYAGRFSVREYASAGVVYWTGTFKGSYSGRRVRWA